MPDHLNSISREGKILMLAYDQGFEHGPADFNEQNFHPNYILDLARNGGYNCLAMHFGIANKFWKDKYEDVPLVVKMNGKSSLGKKAYSVANCTVQEIVSLGAKAAGFTIYLGGEYEAEMIREFSQIRREAHSNGLAVFAWMYPFITMPSSNDDERNADIIAYATRVGAELGADVIKIKYPHQPEALPWIIKNAVGTKALLSGGDRPPSDEDFLNIIRSFMDSGGAGLAVGRNAWQHPDPLSLTARIKSVIWPS